MKKVKLIDEVRAELISSILKDIIRETQGEETLKQLEELMTLRGRIQKCADEPKLISFEDVERFNRLVSKLFPERDEK